MIVFIFSFFIIVSSSFAQGNINTKITSTSKQIKAVSQNYSMLNKKMATNAKAIIQQRKEINKQNKILNGLKVKLLNKENSYKENKVQLSNLVKHNDKLKNNQNFIEEELVFVIAKSVSLSVILEGDYSTNEDSLMEFEILQEMLKSSKNKATHLSGKYYENAKDIKLLTSKTLSLAAAIKDIDTKRVRLNRTQKLNKKSLKKLEVSKSSYKKKVKSLLRKQDTLKKTLSSLNIIKIDTMKKKKEEKERKLAFSNKDIVSDKSLVKVKQVGTSYKAIKTRRYKGRKTIAPLDSYTITKNYGTYTDPIYGIKIFNESISLKPRKSNAKVKTVFNGKVIYADKTAVLDNIVIVEHRNGLHTIYANLSQIAPNIKKGKKVKKGYSIGRVNEELIFEVTQQSFHINPIRLFK